MKIIAEIGVNHDGRISKAKKLILLAKQSRADYVKFQFYKTENIVVKNSLVAQYQRKFFSNQFKMLKQYELNTKDLKNLLDYCKKIKIKPLITCFDLESFNEVEKFVNLKLYKISSGDLDNLPLLYYIAKKNKNLILSTGMSNLNDIELALKTILFARKYKKSSPKLDKINKIKLNKNNLKYLKKIVTILHCVSEYPTKLKNLNLLYIKKLQEKYKLNIGLSDHSKSLLTGMIAFTLDAKFLEKHITISNEDEGPDHKASLNYNDFSKMIDNVKMTQIILGKPKKKISKVEIHNKLIARKSLVANGCVRQNEKFSLQNIAIKRPQTGKKPRLLWNLIGKKSKKMYKHDELIS